MSLLGTQVVIGAVGFWAYTMFGALCFRLKASRTPCKSRVETTSHFVDCGTRWSSWGDSGIHRCEPCGDRYGWKYLSAIWPLVLLYVGVNAVLIAAYTPVKVVVQSIALPPHQGDPDDGQQ